MTNQTTWRPIAAAILTLSLSGGAFAQASAAQQADEQAPATQPAGASGNIAGDMADEMGARIDAKAQDLIDRVRKTYEDLQAYSFNASFDMKVAQGEQSEELSAKMQAAVARPASFLVTTKSEAGIPDMYSDGKTFVLYSATENAYLQRDAEGTIASTLEAYNANHPVSFLLRQDPMEELLGQAMEVTHGGTQKLDGETFEVLSVKQDDGQVDIFITKDDKAVIRQVKAELAQGPSTLNLTLKVEPYSFDKPKQDQFTFQPPEGAEKVEPRAQQDEGAHDLVGTPAPEFSFATLDGGKLSLADLKGKVAVLDFWATWCGPCVQALPKLHSVTKELAEQGVVFVAVNLREDKEQIQQFLKKHDLEDVRVGLDEDGSAADAFAVEAIPQTVVVGPDGVIRHVHVGFAPGTETQLKTELTALLNAPRKQPSDE